MNTIKLGQITSIKTGKLNANAASIDGKYPFFTCGKEVLKIDKYSYDSECVLVAGNGDLNVKYFKGKFDAYQRTYIVESKDKNKFHTKYLYYFLDQYLETLRELSIGGVIKYIKLENLTEAEIYLPSIDKQIDIVNTLDKTASLKIKRNNALSKLNSLIQSVFLDMFGDPNLNPKCWEVTTIGESCYFVKDGPHVSPHYVENGVPFITVNNIIKGYWDMSKVRYISLADHEMYKKRCHPEKGDVLYTKGGTTGFAKYIDVDFEFSNWVHIAVLKFDKKRINGRFLECMLNTPYCYEQSQNYTRGIANRDLVLGQMKRIKHYIPPLELQNKFAEIIEKILVLKENSSYSRQKIDSLFASCTKHLLEGNSA